MKGDVMDVLDVAILVSMGMLVVFFVGVAVLEWRDARSARRSLDGQPDAQVIQHARSDRRVNPAA
jgi:hypothetical protein